MQHTEDSLKAYRDVKNSIDTAMEQGIAKGMGQGIAKGMEQGITKGMEQGVAKGKIEVAKAMLQRGIDLRSIAELTGLTEREIQSL